VGLWPTRATEIKCCQTRERPRWEGAFGGERRVCGHQAEGRCFRVLGHGDVGVGRSVRG
jgi:hypothetical protein